METKDAAPAGLCKIGDAVRYKDALWSLEKIGLKNKNGYALDILIVCEEKEVKISAHDGKLLIYPPKAEIPAKLQAFADEAKLDVIRDPHNGDDLRYALACRNCNTRCWLKTITEEGGEFGFDAVYGFTNHGHDIIDTEYYLRCDGCERSYLTPEDFEVNWD